MRFLPHILLQDSYAFFQQSGLGTSSRFRWNYRAGKAFQVEGDKGSIQRLTFVYLEQYIQTTKNVDISIGFVEERDLPFSPALIFEPAEPKPANIAEALRQQEGIQTLLDQARFFLRKSSIYFPVTQVFFETSYPPIDFQDLHQRYENSEDIRLFLELYFSSIPEKLKDLERAIAESRTNEAHRIAHSIKGGALSVAANELAGIAKEIEVQLKNGQTTSKIQEQFPLVAQAYERARRAWQLWEKEHAS